MAGRSEPDLGLARRRAAGDLLEIGTDLLALTDAETGAIAAAEGHPLSPDQARALTARTEGWVAGVHLAALDQSREGAGAGLLGDVSGRDRYIAAYFRSEFQRDLADADLAVLTRTSILDTVTASSAVAVSGIRDAGERIETVARASLLIQELGGSAAAYRYHNLLRDFLRGELDRREPDARPDLHRRAARVVPRDPRSRPGGQSCDREREPAPGRSDRHRGHPAHVLRWPPGHRSTGGSGASTWRTSSATRRSPSSPVGCISSTVAAIPPSAWRTSPIDRHSRTRRATGRHRSSRSERCCGPSWPAGDLRTCWPTPGWPRRRSGPTARGERMPCGCLGRRRCCSATSRRPTSRLRTRSRRGLSPAARSWSPPRSVPASR